MEFKRAQNEDCFHYSMRWCLHKGIIVYPRPVSEYSWKLEVSIKNRIFKLNTQFKAKPIYAKDKVWYEEIYKLYYIIAIMENNSEKKNILEEAADIIYSTNGRREDYGPFKESMMAAAKIMTELTGKQITGRDFYLAMISLKLARLKYSDKHDTYVDLLGYIAGAADFVEDKQLKLNL